MRARTTIALGAVLALGVVPMLPGPRAARPAPCPARSSDWLNLLPDGAEKRQFIIDCTNCHQFGERQAFLDGAPRARAEWEAAVTRMVGYAGATTRFPIISAGRDPAATARWLTAALGARTPAASCDAPLPAGATVTEFLMPDSSDLPHDLLIEAGGRVLVTGMFTHRLWSLAPGATAFTEIPIPVERANPRAIEADDTGDRWLVLGNPHRLARWTRDGRWDSWDVGMYAHSLATDRQGRVWFNGHFTRAPEQIGYVEPSGRVTTIDVPAHPALASGPGGPIPYELRVAPDGRIWMSELQGNRIIGYDPERRTFTVRDLPTPVSAPRRFDIDARGVLWIPAYAGNALVRYDPAADRFETIPMPVRDAVPYVVRVQPRTGTLWIGTSGADAMFAFDPATRRFTTYPLPSRGAVVRHIAFDPGSRDVWLAYGASPGIPARIARLSP